MALRAFTLFAERTQKKRLSKARHRATRLGKQKREQKRGACPWPNSRARAYEPALEHCRREEGAPIPQRACAQATAPIGAAHTDMALAGDIGSAALPFTLRSSDDVGASVRPRKRRLIVALEGRAACERDM